MEFYIYELVTPYDNFDKKNMQKFYTMQLEAKLKGYKTVYSDVIPVDGYDLICDHVLMCIPGESGIEVACTLKSIRYSTCKRFGLELPCFPLAKSWHGDPNTYRLIKSMEAYQDDYQKKGYDLFYTYSWTIDKKYRGTEIGKKLKEMTLCWFKFYADAYNAPGIFITGMEKVKTDKNFLWCGFEHFKDKQGKIGHIQSPKFNNERALMLKHESWSNDFLDLCNKYEDYYKNRIIIGGGEMLSKLDKKEAA